MMVAVPVEELEYVMFPTPKLYAPYVKLEPFKVRFTFTFVVFWIVAINGRSAGWFEEPAETLPKSTGTLESVTSIVSGGADTFQNHCCETVPLLLFATALTFQAPRTELVLV